MIILLLNPPDGNTLLEYPDEDGSTFIETEDFGFFPPLGLLYIISYLKKHTRGHQIHFKDCVAEKISHRMLKEYIRKLKPDVVGITSFTISMIDVCYAAKSVREQSPAAHICLGGHHPIAFPVEAAGLTEFDSIIIGEGEVAFTKLIECLAKNTDITRIQGVYTSKSIEAYKSASNGQTEKSRDKRFLNTVMVPPAYIEDIDSLPMPDRSFIKHIKYHSIVGATEKLATMISSRGCPYRCTFCDVPYKLYRKRSIKHVVDEIEQCLAMGYEEIHFYDDLFNITPERVIEFCDEIKVRRLKFIWDFRGRVNTVTKASLAAAKQSGCRLISFGVETGTNEGLVLLRKQTTVAKIKEVFRWCRELRIKTIADFMIGLPFEKSKADIMKNLQFLIDLNPDYPQISILSLYPNTTLYYLAIEKGMIPKDKWKNFAEAPTRQMTIDHWEAHLPLKELVTLQKLGYKRFYLRPAYILRNIFNTRSMYEFKTKTKGFLKLLLG